MKTLKITQKDLNANNEYIGKMDVTNFNGNIEIDESLGCVLFKSISVTGYLWARAGSGIKAGWGIKAGSGIKAGLGIEAGSGIKAGLSITCRLSLKITKRIFAGLAIWKGSKEIRDSEKTITCGKLESGEVCYGILKEVGMPKEKKEIDLSGKEVSVTVDGKTYRAIIK